VQLPDSPDGPELIAVFGPTAVGKTSVAVELARILREGGERPVAVNCDSIQVYRGLEVLSGAPGAKERAALEHRLVSFVPIDEEYSAGRFASDAHREIDDLRQQGQRPLLVGGTGLYLRAAISQLDLRPPVPAPVRQAVERDLVSLGSSELHRRLPEDLQRQVHPNDRKRIARYTEVIRIGERPAPTQKAGGTLWSAPPRRPTLLFGITASREELDARIDARVMRMVDEGVCDEAQRADLAGASRTARAGIGFEEFLAGDIPLAAQRQRSFARRQLTWMRKMEVAKIVSRQGRDDLAVASEIAALVRGREG
jgi:tRNA dimethylallyltransferase